VKHWQSDLCSYVDSLTAEEQCPIEGPKTTPHPSQGNRNAHKLVLGGDGSRTGVIVGTVVGCSAVVALIVALTILVSMLVPAYDFNTKVICMLRLHFEFRRTIHCSYIYL